MPYRQQPFSFIYQSGDSNHWLDVHKALNPAVLAVINDGGLLNRALTAIPKARYGWIRFYHADDGHWWGKGLEPVKRLVKQYRDSGITDPRALLYISNEPSAGNPDQLGETEYLRRLKTLVQFHVDAMDYANEQGIGTIVLNSTAAFRESDINDGHFDPLLRRLADKTVPNLQGHHQYGNWKWQMSCAGRLAHQSLDKAECQPDKQPSPYDVQIGSVRGNWLTGRHYWFDNRCDVLGIPRPDKADSENSPSDRHRDYENAKYPDGKTFNLYQEFEKRHKRREVHNGKEVELIVPWPHTTMRGQDTMRFVYEDYYPGRSFEQVLLDDLKWLAWVYDDYQIIQESPLITRRKSYMAEPTMLGVNLFVWSPGKDDWDITFGFDWSKYGDLHAGMVAWSRQLESALPDVPPPPPPPDPDPDPPPISVHKQVALAALHHALGVVNVSIAALQGSRTELLDKIDTLEQE